MFRLTNQSRNLGTLSLRSSILPSRNLSISGVLYAKAVKNSKDGKKKVKQGFKVKNDGRAKVKKGGMTQLKFRDAVRSLGFEKGAPDLDEFDIGSLSKSTIEKSEVVKYAPEAQAALEHLGSFKKYQNHELFRQPISLITENTRELNQKFVEKLESESVANRVCLLGQKDSGKSTLVAQIQALALDKYNGDVVLLHFDHPQRIVEGSSDYVFNKKMEKYQQPMFTKRWIKKVRAANESVFKKMPLTRDISFVAKKKEHHLKKDEHTVYDFVLYNHDFGKVGPSTAFEFLTQELLHHSKQFPVVASIDDFNVLTSKTLTRYRHPNFEPIHFKEFEMGSFIMELVSGRVNFSKGGVIVAETKDFAEGLTLPVGLGIKEYDPYYRQSECDIDVANDILANGGVKHHFLTSLSKDQARSLMKFWKSTGILQIREYPKKENISSSNSPSDAFAPNSSEISETDAFDVDSQFEKLLNTNFSISAGNPGHLLKSSVLTY